MDARIIAAAVLLPVVSVPAVQAQGIATDRLIDSITVTAERNRTVIEAPSPAATKTAADLRAQNLVNPEDALKYVPNLTIRKRYIGDRNALIAGRSFSTLQAPRGLVFMDGYLLSNFLGRFDAPRWNMITPEEIERIDVLYGPFSAIYPGNSIGTTVAVRTRRPAGRELSVRTTGFSEQFEEYGLEDTYGGYQVSGFLGERFDGGAWFTLAANRQDAVSHPQQYFSVSANAAGQFPRLPPSTAPATAVSGVTFDVDPLGAPRAVFGAGSGAIDHTQQSQWKLRGGHELTDWLEAEAFLAQWTNDTRHENRTFLRDSAGNEVWQGRVSAQGVEFDVPAGALAPNTREERHVQWGTTLRTTRDAGWNASAVFSKYEISEDSTLEADNPDPVAALGGSGTNTERDGTRWHTFELQGVYTPLDAAGWRAAHTLTVGYHRNDYELQSPVYDTPDWRRRGGELAQDVRGETSVQALYVQDAWQMSERWGLTLGLRYEDWQASDGVQFVRGLAPEIYGARSDQAWSPKASISFRPDSDWLLRLSAGRGVRFPTVAELFLGTVTATQITRNDPRLKPERSDALDLSVERSAALGTLRLSLFQDDIRDTIWNQVDIFVFPRRNTVQNIDRVRTRGVEAAFTIVPPSLAALSIEGSLAYARSEILRNDKHPDYVGNHWPRIPNWRGNLQAVWRPTQDWLAMLGIRYSGRMYNRLENDDINPDTYGGVSRFTMLDARVAYTTSSNLELALGVDNLTNEYAYQSHPYPARTGYAELRWSFGGVP